MAFWRVLSNPFCLSRANIKLLHSLKANVSSMLCAGINAREPVPCLVQISAAAFMPVDPQPAVRWPAQTKGPLCVPEHASASLTCCLVMITAKHTATAATWKRIQPAMAHLFDRWLPIISSYIKEHLITPSTWPEGRVFTVSVGIASSVIFYRPAQ